MVLTQTIEIEGDLARIVTREVVQQVSLQDILPFIENRPPFTMFHPRSAIFTHWDESDPNHKKLKFLCELAPGIRSIVKSNRRYRLAIPWTYFVFSFELRGEGSVNNGQNWSIVDYYTYHAPTKVRTDNYSSRLWTAFLPNVYENGNICFGTTGASVAQSLADRVDQLVNDWYLTQFNNDVHGSRSHPLPFNGTLPYGWALWVNATREHGLQAMQMFPEWDITDGSNGVTSYTVEQVLTGVDTSAGTSPAHHLPFPTERLRLITTGNEIPAIETGWSFGRLEEWFEHLDPVAKFRLRQAANNYHADNPNAEQAPPPPAIADTDDGGELITDGT
jgi:hypothetical protein